MNDIIPPVQGFLQTGQRTCHDINGLAIPCVFSGQDAGCHSGLAWPEPRFEQDTLGIVDQLTGLLWRSTADIAAGPMTWCKALDAVAKLNEGYSPYFWRLPNINELESLVDCGQYNPALPMHHPFTAVQDIYWSSTTSLYEPDWAWALYMDKGAIGVGQKGFARFHAWAVTSAI